MKPPRREDSSALRPWGGAQPPLAGWVGSSPRRVSACPQGRATPQTPLHREMPSRMPKLSLYRVCPFASEVRGLLMIWARGLTWAAERLRRMHPVADEGCTRLSGCRRQMRAHPRDLGPTLGCRRAAPETCNALFVDVVAACVWREVLEGCRRDALPPGVLAWRPCMACCRTICVVILISLTRARARRATLLRFCAVGPIFYRLYSYLYSSFPKLRKESSSKMRTILASGDEIRAAEC